MVKPDRLALAVITEAASGIGRALAEVLTDQHRCRQDAVAVARPLRRMQGVGRRLGVMVIDDLAAC